MRDRSSWAHPLTAGLSLLVALVAGQRETACADNLVVKVTAEQHITLVGRAPSLKSVIEDVCFRAGIDLLYYDAADRPFGGTYQEMPIQLLLSRILSQESYMAETVLNARPGPARVVVLRVLGDPASASARRARGGGGGVRRKNSWQVPSDLLATAFDSSTARDTAERETALTTLAVRISGDPAQLQGFLGTDSRLIAQTLRRYKGVEEPLRDMQQRYRDPRIAAKIDEIITALAASSPETTTK